jgi:aerobic-type carbon monoxide dehydrogenase small subunit (CoxS/CutS family)
MVTLNVNGQTHQVNGGGLRTLAQALREDLSLTGTKVACGEGTCGSCTVLIDDRPQLSCLTLVAAVDGRRIRTVEDDGELLARLQAAFVAEDGLQCGYCTPGQLMSAVALLEREPKPDTGQIVEAMSGNLCRCGAYEGIAAAVARVAAES